jgi:hypothetical protein
MIIYEVNLTVTSGADTFAIWLADHIREILRIDGFISAEWCEVEGAPPEETQWCVHYRLQDRESLENYFTHHAERMRADGLQRFGGKFSATRRILVIINY